MPKLTGLTANVTVSGWVNIGNTTTSNRIRFIELNLNANGYAGTMSVLYRPSDGQWLVRSGNGTSTNSDVLTHTYTLTQSTWYNICFTRDDSTNVTNFYVNGFLQDTETVSVSSSYPSNATGVIGDLNYSAGLNYNWLGSIDQVRIFSSALTSSQVTELYNEKPEVDTSNFKAVLYEGNGGTQYISNVGMDLETDGGLVWVKSRDTAYHHRLVDSVRGLSTDGVLFSNLANAAEDLPSANDNFTSFDKNGFTLGSTSSTNGSNFNGDSFAAWNWKGGGPAVSNTDGTIASQVSANQAAGFSIVTYTGTGNGNVTSDTVGHGLSQTPDIVIVKSMTATDNWQVEANIGGTFKSGSLNGNGSFSVTSVADPTSTTFNPYFSNLAQNYVAYCWHSVAKYSKIGSYTGNGSTTGTIVTLDFAPSFVMIKGTDQTSDWIMIDNKRDTTNPNSARIDANSSSAEYTGENIMDLNSNGFQLKTSSASKNGLNKVFIYMAFK